MGVYIKGMRMPENGFECELQAWDNSCNAFALDEKIICDDPNYRHPNCPLVEVAEPHGRLVDLDALEKERDSIDCHGNSLVALEWDDECILNAPTVIESEK